MTIEGLLRKAKPSTEALTDDARTGIEALDRLVKERNTAMTEVAAQRQVIDKLTMENEGLRQSNVELQRQRDFWMRTNARVEALLNNLWGVMNTLGTELQHARESGYMDTQVQAIAQRFAPEGKNEESVG